MISPWKSDEFSNQLCSTSSHEAHGSGLGRAACLLPAWGSRQQCRSASMCWGALTMGIPGHPTNQWSIRFFARNLMDCVDMPNFHQILGQWWWIMKFGGDLLSWKLQFWSNPLDGVGPSHHLVSGANLCPTWIYSLTFEKANHKGKQSEIQFCWSNLSFLAGIFDAPLLTSRFDYGSVSST